MLEWMWVLHRRYDRIEDKKRLLIFLGILAPWLVLASIPLSLTGGWLQLIGVVGIFVLFASRWWFVEVVARRR